MNLNELNRKLKLIPVEDFIDTINTAYQNKIVDNFHYDEYNDELHLVTDTNEVLILEDIFMGDKEVQEYILQRIFK